VSNPRRGSSPTKGEETKERVDDLEKKKRRKNNKKEENSHMNWQWEFETLL